MLGRCGRQPTKQVPRPASEESTLCDMVLILENKLKGFRVLDYDTWRKAGHRDLVRLESEDFLALHEPIEKDMSGSQELDCIAKDR